MKSFRTYKEIPAFAGKAYEQWGKLLRENKKYDHKQQQATKRSNRKSEYQCMKKEVCDLSQKGHAVGKIIYGEEFIRVHTSQ